MRSMLAQLSPHEENTLRRVARGEVIARELPEPHVTKLKRLALVEEIEGSVRLTEVGIRRHAELDRPENWIAETVPTTHRRFVH